MRGRPTKRVSLKKEERREPECLAKAETEAALAAAVRDAEAGALAKAQSDPKVLAAKKALAEAK
jgi:hypothetical protein